MQAKLRGSLTYANVVATLALFIALGGGAYAATHLAKNSVGSKQLRAGAVKTKKLAKGAVTTSKVADQSLLGADFAPGQIPAGAKGATGPAGPSTGPAGGDLTGNYPDPQIASGAVTGADVADNSVPGSDLVTNSLGADKIQDATLNGADVFDRGLDAEDIGLNLVVTVDLLNVPAGGCIPTPMTLGPAELGEIVFILPTGGLQTTGLIFPPTIRDPSPLPDAVWQVCNLTASAIDPPSQNFRIMSISP